MRSIWLAGLLLVVFVFPAEVGVAQEEYSSKEFQKPFLLEADGAVIDICKHSRHGHASPCLFDIDGDGKFDLIVGDFPGNFWVFKNVSSGKIPKYEFDGKLKAGGQDATVPVY